MSGGDGLVSHAGAGLLADGAGSGGAYEAAFVNVGGARQRQRRHDRGRVIRDLAVMVANRGDSLSDLRAVRDQEPLFGRVASDATAFG